MPEAAGTFLCTPTRSVTYSICPFAYMHSGFDKANFCNLKPGKQLLTRPEGDTIWVSDLSLQAQGSFCPAWSLGAATPPPNARAGTNGYISHLQQRPSEHKQFYLPPQPFVLTMATAPCPSRCLSCVSRTQLKQRVKSGCAHMLRSLLCFEIVLLHYFLVHIRLIRGLIG